MKAIDLAINTALAIALIGTTIYTAKVASAAETDCKPYHDYADSLRGNTQKRWEYITAKRMARACDSANKSGTDIGFIMALHEQNDKEEQQQIDKNLLVSKYAN